MVGARSGSTSVARCRALGADAYLPKPFLMADLNATLERLLAA